MTWIFTGASTATILGSTAAAGTAAGAGGAALGAGIGGGALAGGGLAAAEGAGAAAPAIGAGVTEGGLGSGAIGTNLTGSELAGGGMSIPVNPAPGAVSGGVYTPEQWTAMGGEVPSGGSGQPQYLDLADKRLDSLMNTPPPPVDQPKPGPGGLPGPESIGLPDPGGPQPGAMPKLSDAMGPLDSILQDSPPPPAAELPPRPTMATPPSDWQSQMKGAHQALRLASKMVKGPAQDTLNMMAMTTGAGANVSDPVEAMKMTQGPLNDIATSAQEKQQKEQMRLQKAMPLPGTPPPMPAQTQMTPQAATSYMPPTSALTPEQRIRLARGY